MSAFIKKKNDDGTENPRYVDLLEEDKAISGQSYVCVSFVSPENTLKKRELFLFEHFLKHFDFSKSMKKFTQFINFLSYKYSFEFEKAMTDFQDFFQSVLLLSPLFLAPSVIESFLHFCLLIHQMGCKE